MTPANQLSLTLFIIGVITTVACVLATTAGAQVGQVFALPFGITLIFAAVLVFCMCGDSE